MCSMHITSLSLYNKCALGSIPFYRRRIQGCYQFNSLLKLFGVVVATIVVPRVCWAQRLGSSLLGAFAMCQVLCAHDKIEETDMYILCIVGY